MTAILGSRTTTLVRDDFALLEFDAIRVKGKTEREVIYALLRRISSRCGRMSQVLTAYRKQNWSGALRALGSCRQKVNGLDMGAFCELYEARIKNRKVELLDPRNVKPSEFSPDCSPSKPPSGCHIE